MTTKIWIRDFRSPIKIKLMDIPPIIVTARVDDALILVIIMVEFYV
jgi:hypothetical protein